MEEVAELKRDFKKHLEESIGIKVKLNVNTILTGLILAVVVGKVLSDWFK